MQRLINVFLITFFVMMIVFAVVGTELTSESLVNVTVATGILSFIGILIFFFRKRFIYKYTLLVLPLFFILTEVDRILKKLVWDDADFNNIFFFGMPFLIVLLGFYLNKERLIIFTRFKILKISTFLIILGLILYMFLGIVASMLGFFIYLPLRDHKYAHIADFLEDIVENPNLIPDIMGEIKTVDGKRVVSYSEGKVFTVIGAVNADKLLWFKDPLEVVKKYGYKIALPPYGMYRLVSGGRDFVNKATVIVSYDGKDRYLIILSPLPGKNDPKSIWLIDSIQSL